MVVAHFLFTKYIHDFFWKPIKLTIVKFEKPLPIYVIDFNIKT
jgi:hypothetical protein